MKHTLKKAAAGLLAMALVVGIAPANIGTGGLFGGTSITAYADETETLLTTITAVGASNANTATSANVSYSTEDIATLTFSQATPPDGYGRVAYTPNWGWWGYGITLTVTPADGYTITKCVFYDDANRTATDSEAPFAVETTEADKTPQVNGTPILANTSKGITKIDVYGYATPTGDTTSTYTLTIPSTLTVANSGWNSIGNISATGDLAEGKKLGVTATSTNSFALKSGSNSVGYKLANNTESEKTYSDATATTSWDFTNLTTTPQTQAIGIVVEDYSDKPAGDYSDTVTFTASVEDAVTAPTLAGVTLTDGIGVVIKYNLSGTNTVYFKYVAASDTFVPDYANYSEVNGSKYAGDHACSIVDQNWNGGSNNFYFRRNGNTANVYGNDGISMSVYDIQLDFDNMTYTQSYKKSYNAASGSFTSIKIGDTTITASQMTAQ